MLNAIPNEKQSKKMKRYFYLKASINDIIKVTAITIAIVFIIMMTTDSSIRFYDSGKCGLVDSKRAEVGASRPFPDPLFV